ncbi:WD40-repeat-containing domain protein [Hyaloraphidium curvatum]|nr:WD40-repeat-containing domain protein [Hyaloraphidium curvatum]
MAPLPPLLRAFDSLAPHLKSFVLLQLLRRSPVATLQLVGSLVLPALKRDFLRMLPVELAHQIMLYLDLRSLGRAARVSRAWRAVVEGPDAEVAVWRARLLREGWLHDDEVRGELARWRSEPGADTPDADDMVVDFPGPPPRPLHMYRALYRRHHVMRRNWTMGRYRRLSFPAHGFNVVTCLQFDGEKIVSGSDDQTMNVYDVRTGDLLRKLEGHEGGVWALQYIGHTLVSGSTDRTVRVWDLDTGRCTHVFDGHTSTVRCLAIVLPRPDADPDGPEPTYPLVVTGSRDATLRVWRLPDPKVDPPYNGARAAHAGGEDDGDAPAFDDDGPAENPYFVHVLTGHTNSVRALAASGNTLVSGSYDTTVRVWNLATGECSHVLRGHREKVYSVGYSEELKRAVSGSMDATVRVWDVITGECLHVLEGHNSLVGLLELTPSYLVSAAADATLRIWNPANGQCLATLQGHAAAITCFHHDPALNRIVSGSDGGVKIWELSNLAHGRFQRDLVTNVQGVWRVRMDERRLVCAVQREGSRTFFEVLDFGAGVDVAAFGSPCIVPFERIASRSFCMSAGLPRAWVQ